MINKDKLKISTSETTGWLGGNAEPTTEATVLILNHGWTTVMMDE